MRRTLLVSMLYAAVLAGCGGDDNQPPVLTEDTVSTPEDTAIVIDVLANDSDPDGEALLLRTAEAEGYEVEIVGDKVRVTPPQDFVGEIVVAYAVSDGFERVASQATVTVTPVNDAPVAGAVELAVGRNAALPITLTGSDVDGDELTFEVTAQPAHGTLSGTAPDLIYTPAQDYVGADTLSYVARDAEVASPSATVAVTVIAGVAPVGQVAPVTTPEDVAVAVTLAATDGDGDALTFAVVTPPAHGTLSGTTPNLTYTPGANYHGSDAMTFTATDGLLTSAVTQVTLAVTPVNDPPQAVVTPASTSEDTSVALTLGTDVDGDALTVAIVTPPAHGALTGTGAARTYVPTANTHGPDAFTFTVSDGTVTSAPATKEIAVASAPDLPVAVAQIVQATEDQSRQITLGGSDGDGDAITFEITGAAAHGTITGTGSDLTYTPNANYAGPDTITFVASAGGDTSAPAAIAIQVAAVDDAPTAASVTIPATEDQAVSFVLPGADVDGDALTYSIVQWPAPGALTGAGANRVYTPSLNSNGSAVLVYRVADGHGTADGTVTIQVAPVNDPPVAHDDVEIAAPDTALTISPTDNDDIDVDGDHLTITLVSEAGHGTLELVSDPTSWDEVIYTPDDGFLGSDAFTYTISDGAGGTATATVRVGTGQFPATVPATWVARARSTNAAGPLDQLDLSADGRYVAFVSEAALVGGDNNNLADIFVYDRLDGGLELISQSSTHVLGNGASEGPSLSADGRLVAFASAASNLVAGDSNGMIDVFVHDRVTGVTSRASVGPGGVQGSGPSYGADLSASGTRLAFASGAFELVASDANGTADVFVRDLEAGTTTRVSVSTTGGEGDSASLEPAISGDGRIVAFRTAATNLVPGDTNNMSDILVHDLETATTERVSVTSTGTEGNNNSSRPTLSHDGRFVSFVSSATNLVTAASHVGLKVFVRDRQAITTTWAFTDSSAGSGIVHDAHLSGDGRYLTGHLANGSSFIRDRFSGAVHAISTVDGNNVYLPVLSANGRYVAVISANALVPLPAGTLGSQVFVLPNPL